jgi:hypothetical protein
MRYFVRYTLWNAESSDIHEVCVINCKMPEKDLPLLFGFFFTSIEGCLGAQILERRTMSHYDD